MKHLEVLKVYSDKRSCWPISGPLDGMAQWNVELTEAPENESITWTSLEGVDVDNSGAIPFQLALGDCGTVVAVVTEYTLPGGVCASAIAKFFTKESQQQLTCDLCCFT